MSSQPAQVVLSPFWALALWISLFVLCIALWIFYCFLHLKRRGSVLLMVAVNNKDLTSFGTLFGGLLGLLFQFLYASFNREVALIAKLTPGFGIADGHTRANESHH